VAGEDAFERIGSLVALLTTTTRPLTLDEIAHRVGGYPDGRDARRKAFQREKATLAAAGIRITERDDRYRILPEHYFLPDLDLTDDERAALDLAIAAVPVVAGEAPFALATLGALGAAGGRSVHLRAQLADLPVLPLLHGAMRARATVAFRYDGLDRVVDPYGLLFREGWWYLCGHDRTRDARRWYRLDRIDGAVATGGPGSAAPVPALDVAAEFASGPWAIGGGESVDADVEVDAVLAAQVVADLGPDAVVAERDDGGVVVRLQVSHRPGFRSWLLGLLDHAAVTGPADLRAEVTTWLESIAAGPTAR
jgi:proteasome accessory factor B